MALLFVLITSATAQNESQTRRYRLVWVNDPSTTCTIAWEQKKGRAGKVHFGTEDHGRKHRSYPLSQSVDRSLHHYGMHHCFVRLSDLQPDTNYYFVIADGTGVSERFWFRTAADTQKPFTFIAGGDSRNNRKARRNANRMVAKLRPLFVSFTGDMIDKDNTECWKDWLDDWQKTISDDGRIYPILPHRGNHESEGNSTIYHLFDTTPSNYYALNFSGDLMRYYVLNSEIAEGGNQGQWLAENFAKHAAATRHLMVGYHKPMRPHEPNKDEGTGEYNAWAKLFYQYGVDLVFESDSHVMKRTAPIKPSVTRGSDEGFVQASANDERATIYIGEGCWGAPLRRATDTKDWTLASASFNGFDWVHVYPDRVEVRTVKVDNASTVGTNSEDNVFAEPSNLSLWQPASGTVLRVEGDGGETPPTPVEKNTK